MTPVEICKLSLQTLPQSGADADGDENGSDAPPALQQPCQAARAPAWASCSMLEQAGTPAAKHSSLQGVREAPAPPQSSSGLPKEQESLQVRRCTSHTKLELHSCCVAGLRVKIIACSAPIGASFICLLVLWCYHKASHTCS